MASPLIGPHLAHFESAGDATGAIPTAEDTQNIGSFIASGAIAALDVVSLDAAKTAVKDRLRYVKEQDTAAPDLNLTVGIAIEEAADGETVKVALPGSIVEDVPYTGTVSAAGVTLVASSSTAGALMPASAATEKPIAVSLGAGGSGVVDVLVI